RRRRAALRTYLPRYFLAAVANRGCQSRGNRVGNASFVVTAKQIFLAEVNSNKSAPRGCGALDRGVALRQSQQRNRERLFCRRHPRGYPHKSIKDRCSEGDRPRFGNALSREDKQHPRDW